MAARLSLQGPLDVVKHDTLFADKYAKEGEGRGWDIFPSAKQFVFLKGLPAAPTKLMVVVNWQQLIKGAKQGCNAMSGIASLSRHAYTCSGAARVTGVARTGRAMLL